MTAAEFQLAVISDIHGNRWALEAVLQDINRRRIRRVVNLGDSLYGPLAPAATAEILIPLGLPTVRGNEDRLIVEARSGNQRPPMARRVRGSLTQAHLDWLAALPLSRIAFDDFCLCHGTPSRDDEYLLQIVAEASVRTRKAADLTVKLSSVRQPIVLCGHDHVPRTVRPAGGPIVVNPGSVGLPAYADDVPWPHVMETGTPHARYAIVSRRHDWHIEHVAVPYDWNAAATAARRNGRPDWARWLQTGRAEVAQATPWPPPQRNSSSTDRRAPR